MRHKRLSVCGDIYQTIKASIKGKQIVYRYSQTQEYYVWVSVHHKLIYTKRTNVMQLGSMFICNCNIALHVWDAFCLHLQEHLEIVVAASGE